MQLLLSIFITTLLLKQYVVQCIKEDDTEADLSEFTTTDQTQETPSNEWSTMALKNIAYYLRNHKFNDWDRRTHQGKEFIVNDSEKGFYRSFPDPPLQIIHWNVRENCDDNFYKCIKYLNHIISTTPLTRSEDTTTVLNENPHYSINDHYIQVVDTQCKQLLYNEEISGSPFQNAFEKFQWRTSASYYMCFFTMLGTPDLSMLGEPCDNFANCLDAKYGNHNFDARADDRLPFACAMYSFCPELCCPLKHIKVKSDCFNHNNNPCFIENHEGSISDRACVMDRKENQNLRGLIVNKWNFTCNCREQGFAWRPQFGICVDVNECLTGKHDCAKASEDCLNLPGSYHCICKWGFSYDKISMKCIKSEKTHSMFSNIKQ